MKYAKSTSKSFKAKTRTYKRTYKKSSTKPTKSFVKKVQSVIHKDAENKLAVHEVDSVFFNSGINSTGDMQRILPNVTQGVAEHQRIGEQTRAQKLIIKGHLIMSSSYGDAIASSRICVRLMVVCPKNLQSFPDVNASSTWLSQLLKKGSQNTAFTGLISDLYAPINHDQITCYYDKLIYLSQPYEKRVVNSGDVVVSSNYALDLRRTVKMFSISMKVKNKLLRYNAQLSSTQPTNYAPVLLLGYSHLDGSAVDVTNTQVALSYFSTVQFEDT